MKIVRMTWITGTKDDQAEFKMLDASSDDASYEELRQAIIEKMADKNIADYVVTYGNLELGKPISFTTTETFGKGLDFKK